MIKRLNFISTPLAILWWSTSYINKDTRHVDLEIAIFIKHKTQVPISLDYTSTVPILADTDTYFGINHDYTFLQVTYEYVAMMQDLYVLPTQQKLSVCNHMGTTFPEKYVFDQTPTVNT